MTRKEIAERWKPSPPGTPEWEAQRNFDYARANAHGDVRFLLGEAERLHRKYREAVALVLELRGYIPPTQEQFAPIMGRINDLLAESE